MVLNSKNILKVIYSCFFIAGITACQNENPSIHNETLKSSFKNDKTAGIFNGVNVEDSDPVAKSTVALYFKSGPVYKPKIFNFCTGTLIAKDIVLTAAHCVIPEPDIPALKDDETLKENLMVAFGIKVANSPSDNNVQWREVQAIKYHKDFDMQLIDEAMEALLKKEPLDSIFLPDIAIIKLKAEAPEGYVPATISTPDSLKEGQELIVAGYGIIDLIPTLDPKNPMKAVEAERLLKTNVTINMEEFTKGQFAFVVKDNKNSCSGDSGGPLYMEKPDGSLALVGITSWGDPDCKYFGINTSVPFFNEWIEEVITDPKF